MENSGTVRNLIPEQKSGFAKRIDRLREIFLLGTAEGNYGKQIVALVQIMYEIQPKIMDKKLQDKLKRVKNIYDWFFKFEDRNKRRGEWGYYIKITPEIKEEADEYIFEANSIIMKCMNKLKMCEY